MNISVERQPEMVDATTCDECQRAWFQVYHGCDLDWRPYWRIRGFIGQCPINVVLCPECTSDLADILHCDQFSWATMLEEEEAKERQERKAPNLRVVAS